MQFAARMVLRFIMYTYLLVLLDYSMPFIAHKAIINKYKKAYIAKFTPVKPYTEEHIEDVLKEYNSYGNNKLYSFNEISKGYPIYIHEMPDNFLFNTEYQSDIGVTYPSYTNCIIYLRKGMNSVTFRETLMHEVTHCYGYPDTNKPNDLMYYRDNYLNKEISIKNYAKEIEKLHD